MLYLKILHSGWNVCIYIKKEKHFAQTNKKFTNLFLQNALYLAINWRTIQKEKNGKHGPYESEHTAIY
jgi:hypothetical protein